MLCYEGNIAKHTRTEQNRTEHGIVYRGKSFPSSMPLVFLKNSSLVIFFSTELLNASVFSMMIEKHKTYAVSAL